MQGRVESLNRVERRSSPLQKLDRVPVPNVDNITCFRAELERLSKAFVEPHRQNLIMGVAAYGVRALGLSADAVRKEIATFLSRTDPDELERRLEAVERTLKKHVAGQLVAWHEFYTRAGVDLPPATKKLPTAEVLEKVKVAEQCLAAYGWPGRGGQSDRSVYAALVGAAKDYGTPHEQGVAVSISVRDLAFNARLGDKTVQAALKRLRRTDLVRRDTEVERRFEDAGVLVLLIDRVHKLLHSLLPRGG